MASNWTSFYMDQTEQGLSERTQTGPHWISYAHYGAAIRWKVREMKMSSDSWMQDGNSLPTAMLVIQSLLQVTLLQSSLTAWCLKEHLVDCIQACMIAILVNHQQVSNQNNKGYFELIRWDFFMFLQDYYLSSIDRKLTQLLSEGGGTLGSDVTLLLVGFCVIVCCRTLHVGDGIAPW